MITNLKHTLNPLTYISVYDNIKYTKGAHLQLIHHFLLEKIAMLPERPIKFNPGDKVILKRHFLESLSDEKRKLFSGTLSVQHHVDDKVCVMSYREVEGCHDDRELFCSPYDIEPVG